MESGQDKQFFYLMTRAVREGWELNSDSRRETYECMINILKSDNASDREKTRAAAVIATLDRSFIGMIETGAKIEAGGDIQNHNVNITGAGVIVPSIPLNDQSNIEAIDGLRLRLSEIGGADENGG